MEYLKQIDSTLQQVQSQQLRKLLQQRHAEGAINSIEELQAYLKEQTAALLGEELTSSFKVYPGEPGKTIKSEIYNEGLRLLQNDLEALFAEARSLGDLLLAHQQLVQNVALFSLQRAVQDMERKVRELKFLTNNFLGSSLVQSDTFNTGANRGASRSNTDAPLLYRDPRIGESINADEDSAVDAIQQSLTLGIDRKSQASPIGIRMVDTSDTTATELEVGFPDSDINHLLDGTLETYWLYSILLTEPKSGGITIQLEVDLGGFTEIGYLELEPASVKPMKLTGISYLSPSQDIEDITIDEVVLTDKTRVTFSKVSASKLYLTFSQGQYIESQFDLDPEDGIFYRALDGTSPDLSLDALTDNLREVFRSATILEGGFGITDETEAPAPDTLKYYEYLVGFDNIRVGTASFQNRGVYAGASLMAELPGNLLLSVTETRPEGASFTDGQTIPALEDDIYYHGSIEYCAVRKSFDVVGTVIGLDTIPLLPRDVIRIYHERLLLTAKVSGTTNNIGFLRFYCTGAIYDPDAETGDIRVYRNGTILYPSEVATYSALSLNLPNSGQPMRVALRIDDPSTTDIYTVSYTPALSALTYLPSDESTGYTGTIVDLVGDNSARLVANNMVVFSENKGKTKVARSEFFLQVLMRSNSALNFVSPSVQEYFLAIGVGDQARFED